jgi:6-pyruvoyl-tetrahydropterin synthase
MQIKEEKAVAKRRDLSSKREVSERIGKDKNDMEEKQVDLEKVASDVETVRQTLEKLDFGGTTEGAEQLEKSIESAENITTEVFEKKDEHLESIQSKSKEFEGKITEHRNTSESDLGKISDSSAKIETKETVNELVHSKEVVLKDIDFLVDSINRISDAIKKSDAAQEKLKSRVHSSQRRR